MSDILLLMIAARASTVLTIWAVLLGSAGALAVPDLVRSEIIWGGSFIDRGAVRLFAGALFVAAAAMLTDHYYAWTKGLF